MQDFRQLPKMINRISHISLIRTILNKLFQKQEKVEKVGKAHFGKKADSSGKFSERISIFLEKKYILLVGLFLGSIIILNIFLTLILVIKYL
jgi:hypothetical protein